MEVRIPKLALVVLIGPSGSGKSTFARKHFKPTEVISSDFCRGIVRDDDNDQSATKDAFELLHFILRKRLAAARLTVADATNVQPEARKPLVAIAREFHCIPVAVVFDLPETLCQERNRERPDRNFGAHVIRNQASQLRRSIRALKREGFRHIFQFKNQEDVETATINLQPLWNDRRELKGPFDIFGDVHGCCTELEILLRQLGYGIAGENAEDAWTGPIFGHAEGRMAIFLGDIVDRGPRIVEALTLVRNMVKAGTALCVPGNHDIKLMRKLSGKDVQIVHGLAESLAQIEALPLERREIFKKEAAQFIDSLISHYVLDEGRLVVSHAGLKEEMQGRGSGRVRDFCLFGETTGETDDYGLPVRHNWAAEYRGHAMVVYGHTPIPEPDWLNRTMNIDTGCVFGGSLSALRYPERELASVPAEATYAEPVRPLAPSPAMDLSAQQRHDDLLDAEDVLGKRMVTTRLRSTVTIREENAAAALEVMSRFAVNPKWVIYLPPTMSPSETSTRDELLEHPDEAFAYFRSNGIPQVVCEEKHMGSRAVVVLCRSELVAKERFGIVDGSAGTVYTRTGRRFFSDGSTESQFLDHLRRGFEASGFWTEFQTDWVCMDCELMPWSEKAQELLKRQYAAVGAAAGTSLSAALGALRLVTQREERIVPSRNEAYQGPPDFDPANVLARVEKRLHRVESYIAAYRRYCWPVNSMEDLRLAPFHLLATEGKVHSSENHLWHMETLSRICKPCEPITLSTPHRTVDVTDPASTAAGSAWWEELTGKGGEGMVVKPLDFVAKGKRGLIQPALKCRGREYLRIIYGPEYTARENLSRLRGRALAPKRSLALREFALGIEALERFVRREPLRRTHECVFGVLALESEPVDPRL
jgi:protein phosphatase